MLVLTLSASPARLRGALTRWLAEVTPGVFVGNLSARVRDELWKLVETELGGGRALMVHSARNEQGYDIRSIGHDREPLDLDGCLVLREKPDRAVSLPHGVATNAEEGWSVAGRRRRFGRSIERQLGGQ